MKTEIIRGERVTLTMNLIKKSTGAALDISNASQIQTFHQTDQSRKYINKKLNQTALNQITALTFAALSSGVDGAYLSLYDANNGLHIFWSGLESNSNVPEVSGSSSITKIVIENGLSASQIASRYQAAIDANDNFSAMADSSVVTITNAVAGRSNIPTFSSAAAMVEVSVFGRALIENSVERKDNGTLEVTLLEAETAQLKIEDNATVFIAISFPDPMGLKIYRQNDVYQVIGVDFSVMP